MTSPSPWTWTLVPPADVWVHWYDTDDADDLANPADPATPPSVPNGPGLPAGPDIPAATAAGPFNPPPRPRPLRPSDSRMGRVMFTRAVPATPPDHRIEVLDIGGHRHVVNDLPYPHPNACWLEVFGTPTSAIDRG